MDNKKKLIEDKPKAKSKSKSKSKVGSRKKEKDPRISITIGVLIMLIGLFCLLSIISYLIGYKLTGNWGDTLGMYLSEYSFGIGSLYIIFLIMLSGSLLAFKGPKIKLLTLSKYCFVCLIWLPLFLATILPDNKTCEMFYGLIGLELYQLVEPYISNIGIYIILFFTAFLYVIFTFDIKMPTINLRKREDEEEEDEEEDVKGVENEKDVEDVEGEKDVEDVEGYDDFEDFEDEDVEIVVKHISNNNDKDSTTEDDFIEAEIIDITPKPKELPYSTEDNSIVDDEGFEDVVVTPSTSVADSKDNADDIDMEVTALTEEKQAVEIGEHFGLDTDFDPKLELSSYTFPPLDLLKDYGDGSNKVDREELEANKKRIVDTLANYNIAIDKIKATIGPTVTLYEIIPAAGVRISKIKGLQDDIALCLSAIGIRIIAPIPGKGTVGIEVPNQKPQIVSMRSVLGSERFQKCGYELPFGIGKTISNESYVADLAKMPHILMAGATGQGKSVGINAIISSLLYSKHPAELKFVLVDPKKVELSLYKKIERHFLAKLPDSEEAIITDVRKVVRTLNSLCIEMDNRYELLKDAQVRNIKEYNAKFIARKLNPYEGHRFLPYIVLVVDEFADLIMTAGKEVEAPIARLAQLARAIGIHLIIATQRPSVNIITGTIKANFPARIAFRVISRVDSGTILDTNGADQLIGRGDMLLSTGNDLVRLQCAFIDTPEVEEITDYIGSQRGYAEAYNLPDCPDEKDEGGSKENLNPDERDPLFEEAAYIIVQTQQGSTSMLQRKLKLGYNRAGRIIDQLEKAGIVGPFAGSKQREVKVANEMALEQYLKDLYMDNEE
ncbi:MAG: DNA translocase FtsK [Lentimicrobiaceae bacterium]|nr:DNA translocase FtsK [Lentimicrobiaceae bacterium]